MAGKLSPMMTYYLSLKEEYKDEILFFRLGDFYEMFFDDAIKASNLLGLTLTGRDCGLEERAPMCGIPFHAADGYIAKLIAAGEKVAICEQLSAPTPGKGMVERGVVKVVTSGTATDENSLEQKRGNYLMSISSVRDKVGLAYVDITTGELVGCELENDPSIIESVIIGVMPSEIICSSTTLELVSKLPSVAQEKLPRPRYFDDNQYEFHAAYTAAIKQLNVADLTIYECEDKKSVISALGGLLAYVNKTQMREMSQINDLRIIGDDTYMLLDANTRRNLELTANARDGRVIGSLLWVMDATKTSMGGRLMREWIDRPLKDGSEINKRLDAVTELIENNYLRANLIDAISVIRDIERLSCKIPNNSCSPRDLYALGDALTKLPPIKELTQGAKSKLLKECRSEINLNTELAELLVGGIDDNPPAVARDGGFIRRGFHADLDKVRDAKANSAAIIAGIEAAERERTGIKNLKIRFNRVHGYYIELPKSQSENVPFNYVRRQTTANSERFITEELRSIEEEILSAEERAVALELEIFSMLKIAVLDRLASLQATARAIAKLDVLLSFAETARANGYTRPDVTKKAVNLSISNGRHPVVEKNIGRSYFTANDTYLDNADNRTMIITGPNMAGKSTYMRQVAIIVLMAHIGSYVPADSAIVPLTDRIFTRIGASDDLMTGQSTFMVEMVEVATILKNCTDKSLLILDEIGRGTSTSDGLSIAWAVMEYISANYQCKTLFSTHYHELTALENVLKGVRNYKVSVSEINNQIVFTHRIAKGMTDRSFGIEVADIAGIPKDVIDRAKMLNDTLEKNNVGYDVNSLMLGAKNIEKTANIKQQSFLSDAVDSEVIARLKKLKTDDMTPMQALIELDNLKMLVK